MKKNTSKILLALLVVMTLLVGMTTLSISAADDTAAPEEGYVTIYFENNWLWTEVCCHYWGSAIAPETEWPGAPMTVAGTQDGHDVYSLSVPSDITGLIFSGIKDDGSGTRDQSPDVVEGIVDGACWKMDWADGNLVVSIDYVPGSNSGSDSGSGSGSTETYGSYTVAGTASLCGSEWDTADVNNEMTLGENGLYTKVYENVVAGEHKFKVAADYTWDHAWPGSDFVFTLEEDGCTVTITFDPSKKAVSVSAVNASGETIDLGTSGGSNQGTPGDYGTYTVAGVAGLCGSEWNVGDTYNDMKLNPETGLYEKTFTGVPAGDYECKVAADHAWDQSWGTADNGEFGNYSFSIFEEQNVTITFNAETGEVGHVLSASTGPDENRPTPDTPSADFENCGKITIYLGDSANWGTVKVHAWVENASGDIPYTTWPGLDMNWDADKLLYYIELPEICDSVVFNDGNGTQTADLVIPKDGALFDNQTNEWTDINNYVPPIPPEDTTEDITVYVKDDAGWGDVYIYYWNAAGLDACDFPGVPMELGDDGYYYATIPAGFCSVIFSNGGSWEDGSLLQTPDLRIPTDGKVYLSNGNSCLYNDGAADDNNAWFTKGGNSGNQPDTDNPGTDEPGTDAPGTDEPGTDAPAPKMTFLQKMAKTLLLFLRSIEDFFKGIFKK